MFACGLARLCQFARRSIDTVRARVGRWTTPRPCALATGLATARVRRRHDLLPENACLRQQIVVLSRGAKRPSFTPRDRRLLVLLASRLRSWAGALLIIQPAMVLRWHRQGFRRFWRRKSAARAQPSPLAAATIDLSKEMGRDNPLRGAERIRGELGKLGIRVAKRTIQTYLPTPVPHAPADSPGRRSCATTPTRSGPATSSRSPTCASARCSRISLSRSAAGALSMLG